MYVLPGKGVGKRLCARRGAAVLTGCWQWRLRREPKQGTLNGAPPRKEGQAGDSADGASKEVGQAMGAGEKTETTPDRGASPEAVSKWHAEDEPDGEREAVEASLDPQTPKSAQTSATPAEEPEKQLARLSLETSRVVDPAATAQHGSVRLEDGDQDGDDDEDDEDGEWITPSNIKRHKARENTSAVPEPIQRVLRAALLTTDNAMRNVALRINLK